MKNIITPIVQSSFNCLGNRIFIKREDMIPFSFGGNKVRIAIEYIKDMYAKKRDCMIVYGSAKSNLCRVLTNMCEVNNIPCYYISPEFENNDICNNEILSSYFSKETIYCSKQTVAQTVKKVFDRLVLEGKEPYYIYGNELGVGNEEVPVRAYTKVYGEILKQEKGMDKHFKYIFHASGTGMTQSGLICGNILNDDCKKIVGISIAREKKIAIEKINKYITAFLHDNQINIDKNKVVDKICFKDEWILGGYGEGSSELTEVVQTAMKLDAMPLDITYTGKGFYGMLSYLKENNICNQDILFLHTGGTPLFFDDINIFSLSESRGGIR